MHVRLIGLRVVFNVYFGLSLGEIAGDELGQMLILSFNLTHLDLSFNNIRTKGVQLFFAGLKVITQT